MATDSTNGSVDGTPSVVQDDIVTRLRGLNAASYHLLCNEAADDTDDDTVASALGVNRSTVAKWKAGKNVNLAWWKADAYAVRMGTHPALVWPDWIEKALQGADSDA